MSGLGYPASNEDRTPIAWRCEMCRKLHPMSQPSFVVYIEEIASGLAGHSVKRHSYFVRRMIVCRPCRRTIGDMEGGDDGTQAGRSQPPAERKSTESMGVQR